jgi:hypothetical protein
MRSLVCRDYSCFGQVILSYLRLERMGTEALDIAGPQPHSLLNGCGGEEAPLRPRPAGVRHG